MFSKELALISRDPTKHTLFLQIVFTIKIDKIKAFPWSLDEYEQNCFCSACARAAAYSFEMLLSYYQILLERVQLSFRKCQKHWREQVLLPMQALHAPNQRNEDSFIFSLSEVFSSDRKYLWIKNIFLLHLYILQFPFYLPSISCFSPALSPAKLYFPFHEDVSHFYLCSFVQKVQVRNRNL